MPMKQLVAVSLIVFCGPVTHAETFTVTANSNITFSPSALTIYPGDNVTFTNSGGFHNVHSDSGAVKSFRCSVDCSSNSSPSSSAWSATVNFPDAGLAPYRCDQHSGMTGTITIDGDGVFHSSFDT